MSLYVRYGAGSGFSSGGVPVYANFAAFPASASDGSLAIAADTDILYVFNAGSMTWIPIAGPGSVLSIGTIDSTAPSANGASIVANALIMQSGSGSFPGLITTANQTFSGIKNFSANIFAANLSGTNSGDVTLGTANGLSLSGQVLSLGLASTSTTGALSSADWNTFNGKQPAGSYILANGTIPFTGNQSLGGFNITNSADPTTAQMLATKSYVDAAVSALQPQASVYAATAGSNIAGTYLNGVAGVGATFTTTSTATFTVDGVTPPLASRILIKDQSSGFQNGIYTFTALPVGGISGAVFTRSLDYNTASDMNSAGLIPVINGTVNALSSWQQVATITTVGTDPLVFTEFTANPSLYLLKANNLSDVGSASASFGNISPLTTKGDVLGFSTVNARIPVGTNAQVLTADSTQTLGVKWATPTTGTVTSVALTVPAFLSVAGSPVTSSGTLAISLSGTALPIANGGTAATTATAAYNNLSPMTTTGDIEYESGTNTAARLPIGTAGQVLTVVAGIPAWATPSAGASNTSTRFVLGGETIPYVCIDGSYRVRATNTLASVDISMLNSGLSGSTTIQVNQYRSGVLQATATASLGSSGGNPIAANASLSGSLSVVADDVLTVDVNTVAAGDPSELTVATIFT